MFLAFTLQPSCVVCAVLESGVVPGGEIARNVSVALGMQTVSDGDVHNWYHKQN